MITAFDKKYFILSLILFGMSNMNAMFQSEKQKGIDSQLEQKLQNAACNETVSIDNRASKSLQDTVNLHNFRAQKICKMVEEYNQNCLNEKKKEQLNAHKEKY